MPRPKSLKPAYCHNKYDDRPFVTLDGKRVYLGSPGSYGSQASRDAYDRVIGEWIARGRRPDPERAQPGGVTVAIVAAAFWSHAKKTYPAPPFQEGKRPAGELGNYWDALRPLKRLYGDTPAADFGPLKLKAVRDEMIKTGWCRTRINRQVGRLKHVFKWATEQEMIPPAVYQGLVTVAGLRVGRTEARESAPVRPAPEAAVKAILDHLSPQLKTMVKLQNLTGMRSTELCTLRTGEVDRTGPTWVYRPTQHKTAHHEHARAIPLGPQGRAVIEPFLKLHDPDAFIFSPAESEAWRHAQQRKRRLKSGTLLTPSQRARLPRKRRKRPPGERYDRNSYRRAVQRACDAAFPPPAELTRRDDESIDRWKARLTPEQKAELRKWRKAHRFHPHQLRHGVATRVRKEFGLEAAQAVIGVKTLKVAELYAERSEELAAEVVNKLG